MLERLQEKFNGSEPHTPDEMHWQIDQAVVALFHLENKWHRAKILKVEGHRLVRNRRSASIRNALCRNINMHQTE
jgi:hypothetical protein